MLLNRPLLLGLSSAPFALLLAFACSEEQAGSPARDAGADAVLDAGGQGGSGAAGGAGASGAGAGGVVGGGSGGAGTGGCAAVPEGVPACWERLEYPPGIGECDVYYPGKSAELPPDVIWDDFDLPTEPAVKGRVMNRETPDGDFDPGAFPQAWYDVGRSRVLLSFSRGVRRILPRYRILADAEGPVLNASLSVHPRNTTCEVGGTAFSSERFVLSVFPARVPSTYEGALVWPLGSREAPKVVYMNGAKVSSWRVSDDYIVRWSSGVFVRSWDSDTETSILPSFDAPGTLGNVFARDGAVFTTVTGGAPGTQMWRPGVGSVPFVRFDSTSPRGASNLVTDGRDWAWTEATRTADGWENYELFTSPYSLDPAEVRAKARRVGSEPNGWASSIFAPTVGCGYHARVHPGTRDLLLVTRLSDGHRWKVVGPDLTQIPFAMNTAIAISCDEVFVAADPLMILRIPLSGLGPGEAAD